MRPARIYDRVSSGVSSTAKGEDERTNGSFYSFPLDELCLSVHSCCAKKIPVPLTKFVKKKINKFFKKEKELFGF